MEIGLLKQKRYSLRDIASAMGRAVSTISDEIRRNRVRGRYNPRKAHHKAYVRRKYAKYQGMKIVEQGVLRKEIVRRLYDDQSPQAIAGYMRRSRRDLPPTSKDSIYRFIASVYGRSIEAYRASKKRRWRGTRSATGRLTDRTFIEKRPKRANLRSKIGDAEADFVVSGKTGRGILLVVVDRRSRTTFLERIARGTISNVHVAFLRIKERFPELKTLTMDNDILFARHEELKKLLSIHIYFCHPYHSWEKGSVENANRAIRRDVPKGSDISRYSKAFFQRLEVKLNRRPMKVLRYATPSEMLREYRTRVQGNKKRREGECSD